MHTVEQMLDTYPKDLGGIDRAKLTECIQACFECAQTCTACADACLSEDKVADLTQCIRANLDCGHLHHDRIGALAPHRLRRQRDAGPPRGLCNSMHVVRRQLRAARLDA